MLNKEQTASETLETPAAEAAAEAASFRANPGARLLAEKNREAIGILRELRGALQDEAEEPSREIPQTREMKVKGYVALVRELQPVLEKITGYYLGDGWEDPKGFTTVKGAPDVKGASDAVQLLRTHQELLESILVTHNGTPSLQSTLDALGGAPAVAATASPTTGNAPDTLVTPIAHTVIPFTEKEKQALQAAAIVIGMEGDLGIMASSSRYAAIAEEDPPLLPGQRNYNDALFEISNVMDRLVGSLDISSNRFGDPAGYDDAQQLMRDLRFITRMTGANIVLRDSEEPGSRVTARELIVGLGEDHDDTVQQPGFNAAMQRLEGILKRAEQQYGQDKE